MPSKLHMPGFCVFVILCRNAVHTKYDHIRIKSCMVKVHAIQGCLSLILTVVFCAVLCYSTVEKHHSVATALDHAHGYVGEILLVGINYDKGNKNKPHSCVAERVEKLRG